MLREPKPCGRRFPNTVLHTLAARYARSQAGRTGETARDLILDYEDLLAEAHAGQGDARVCAERDLRDAEHDALLEVERHRRTGKPQCVRFPAANEARLFAKLGLPAPAEQRCQLAAVFEEAAERGGTVPEPHRCAWVAFCRDRAAAALSGASLQPLDRENVDEIREVLALLPRLLSWEGESMIRFASQVLCRDSKRLEQLRGKLEGCLERIAERASDVGILDECDNTKSGVILSAAKDLTPREIPPEKGEFLSKLTTSGAEDCQLREERIDRRRTLAPREILRCAQDDSKRSPESPAASSREGERQRRSPMTLADLGITENERSCLLHGPLLMDFDGGTLDLGLLAVAVRVDRRDIERARFRTAATRSLTVENAAVLHELCKLRTDTIFASSGSEGGYANSATIAFLKRLPPEVECWHFGDSDPNGFDILRDLRDKLAPAGRAINSLHMRFRDDPASPALTAPQLALIAKLHESAHLTDAEKHELSAMRTAGRIGVFEQESLGRPGSQWPFY